jgi:hypothetical protein
MGAPKRKTAPTLTKIRPARAEREAAEMRADVEAYDRAMAARAAPGAEPAIPWEEAERQLDQLK